MELDQGYLDGMRLGRATVVTSRVSVSSSRGAKPRMLPVQRYVQGTLRHEIEQPICSEGLANEGQWIEGGALDGLAYGAGFNRGTEDHIEDVGFEVNDARFLVDDVLKLLSLQKCADLPSPA